MPLRKSLGTLSLVFILYFSTSGGPHTTETLVHEVGPVLARRHGDLSRALPAVSRVFLPRAHGHRALRRHGRRHLDRGRREPAWRVAGWPRVDRRGIVHHRRVPPRRDRGDPAHRSRALETVRRTGHRPSEGPRRRPVDRTVELHRLG